MYGPEEPEKTLSARASAHVCLVYIYIYEKVLVRSDRYSMMAFAASVGIVWLRSLTI